MDEVLLNKFEAISNEEDFSSDQYLDDEAEDDGEDSEYSGSDEDDNYVDGDEDFEDEF